MTDEEKLLARLEGYGAAHRVQEAELKKTRKLMYREAARARLKGISVPRIARALGITHQTLYEKLERQEGS